ncbi:flagellar hook-length control protein FliK [Hoeflea sp. TYP-13]|uniref:flagellar hook-length control protein FliK n=1 Tax=Hoeflea sp. TYP-13 TaxID=3230023 RepID=UPI0034C6B696
MSNTLTAGPGKSIGSDAAVLAGKSAKGNREGSAGPAKDGVFGAAVDAARKNDDGKQAKTAFPAKAKMPPSADGGGVDGEKSPQVVNREFTRKLTGGGLAEQPQEKTVSEPGEKPGDGKETAPAKPHSGNTVPIDMDRQETAAKAEKHEIDRAAQDDAPEPAEPEKQQARTQQSDVHKAVSHSPADRWWTVVTFSQATRRSETGAASAPAADENYTELPLRGLLRRETEGASAMRNKPTNAEPSARMPSTPVEPGQEFDKRGAARALDMFKSARGGSHATAGPASASAPLAERADAIMASGANVTVVEARQFPGLSPTQSSAAAVVGAVSGNESWSAMLRASEATSATTLDPVQNTVNTLKIRLNPAELGNVDATLKLSGNGLLVELKVETPEAFRHLSDSQQQILKALKGQGFTVEQVTVQQVGHERGLTQPSASSGQGGQTSGEGSGQLGQGNSSQTGEGGRSGREGRQEHAHDQQQQNSNDVHGDDRSRGASDAVYL